MFRASAAGPYDEVVTKATDENLTSEDWGAIIEVCDKVGNDQNGPKEAVQSIIRRLAHRNANVQLYTLELAHALAQNCGKNMHRELSSRAFTDALLRLTNDRNTHTQVKSKIIEHMKSWSEMFSSDPELGIMSDAYNRATRSNPNIQPPSAPQKQGLTELDRQKEEDELQMALKLSLQEEERKKTAASSPGAQAGPSGQTESPAPSAPAGTTAATVSRVRALFDFAPSEPGELEFKKGDVIAVLESVYKDWWRGSLRGKTGIFPLNYVEKLTDPTPDELQREAQMEAEVFAEIKNVEKLLTLLSTSNTAPREEDNEEISLNEKFIKARRDYEALLESSMAHPPQHNYQQYAMRPGPGQGYPQAGGYPPQGAALQDPSRYYTPGPQEQPPYQASSPPPNFQNQPQGQPAPFYVAGAEVPAGSQPYPPRNESPSNGKQPAPINTSTPGPNFNPYNQSQSNNPYTQAPTGGRPGSTYGAQELATSVYDSPIATNNPQQPTSAATFSSSVYSPEEPNENASAPPPGPYATHQQQPQQYQSYNPSQVPPMPTGSAPPPPQSVMTPPPLNPGNAGGYDARHGLPSQGGAGGQAQYKPYVPPGDGPSAPAPDSYYQSGGVY
uniref:Class E vacuolar protein-sorting machinery protein HSE1 n=1 Tax=Fusarium oxysporum (strain Fo5176) TaxID=660025 RepID=A0A0D2XH98_FUSOF